MTGISDRHRPKAKRIRTWLAAILSGQEPHDEPFPAVERALAGNLLARLGDPRPGIGVREDTLPDIAWCEVPAGEFLMGSDPEKDHEAYSREQPQHSVTLSAYGISRYPVTNAQYQSFVQAGGYTTAWKACWTPEGWEWKEDEAKTGPMLYGGEFDLPNHPVVVVSWYEATAFCKWLTLRLQEIGKLSKEQEIRLPSEAEWEKAARGKDRRIYPWGNDTITPELANYSDTGLGTTSAVGCFPRGKSPYGCEDLSGNIYEWCLDIYSSKAYIQHRQENPIYMDPGSSRVGRGGSWFLGAGYCRAAYRDHCAPGYRALGLGFRLLRTPL